jgi:hypothetical protein
MITKPRPTRQVVLQTTREVVRRHLLPLAVAFWSEDVQRIVLGENVRSPLVETRAIPQISAPPHATDRASGRQSGNKHKFRVQPLVISALQLQLPRKGTKS